MIERYCRADMADLWSLENRYEAWLKVELAVCEAWFEKGRIDPQSMKEIRERVAVDAERIAEIEEVTRHDVIAFISSLEEKVGPASRFIHLGCTSSDIVDTANALLLVEAGEMILAGYDKLLNTLKNCVEKYRGLICMGRTHGIHAEPTTYSLKFAGFYAEFKRHKERFGQALEDVRVGKLSGAVGTYTVLSPDIEERACEILGLRPDSISSQIVQRDRYANYFTALALAAGGIERICTELRHLQRTEVHEVEEGFGKGQKGSSAMPHKKNPISAENMCGLSRLIRTNALASMENQALWHERDISHSSVERVIMPDSTILMDYVLHRLTNLLDGLRVIPRNVERNLWGSYGLFFSQRVLTALVDHGMPRQESYVMVQECAMQSWESEEMFPDIVRRSEKISKVLSAEVLDTVFDLSYYTRYEQMILDRVFE
ncbi:adenylosuccinate lyase [Taurinivorans muris]|jgi:adenylosuccinate lyase|uniref:Adenylosuccinate lyase n=1 Tax=Taurinivorans muris TaxID=2787751 RepID=A0ABY5XYZ7_9BACT|nr:adenylosuccinate lyase [Desulfovibrionaceae bacterium LT0009]